jgi:hypothetical protein
LRDGIRRGHAARVVDFDLRFVKIVGAVGRGLHAAGGWRANNTCFDGYRVPVASGIVTSVPNM